DGGYSFANLRAGTYTLTETQPSGCFDGKDTIGTPGGNATVNDGFSNIVLPRGYNGTYNNFGELPPSSLAGLVYADASNDSVTQPGEHGISGVAVTLTGTNNLGESVLLTVFTDDSGAYSFTNLRPGTYTLTEAQPDEYLDGKDSIGTQGGTAGN